MTGFLTELGKRVAERLLALLVLPGLVYVAITAVAVVLGQGRWNDAALVSHRLGQALGTGADQHAALARTVVLALVGLVGALCAGFVARALGKPVEHLLSGRWPPFARRLSATLVERRATAWRDLDERCRQARGADDLARFGELTEQRDRLALVEPRWPTWTGDRLHAAATRVRLQYGLDLAAAWPRLWLLLSEGTRAPLTESRSRFDEATVLGGWAVLYAVLGIAWWPAVLVAAGIGLVAWRRARSSAEVYAELVEATIDVYVNDLLDHFDDESHPVRPQRGRAVNERFRKGGA